MTGKKEEKGEKKEKKEEKKEKKEEKKEKKEEKKEKKEEKKEKKEEKKEKKEEEKEKQEEKKEKKEEKMEKKEEKKEKKEEEVEVITAVFRVNIHCRECAREIKKPLLKTQGIYSVDIDCEKSEVKVKGEFDVIKIYKKIKKLSKKKVELISPKMEEVLKKKEEEAKKEEEKEIKEEIIRIISVKVHLHCEKCELDLRKKLLKQKAIYSVKTDMEAEILTIKGTIEPEKLLTYIRKKVHKHAEIIDSKTVKKKDKKKEEEEEEKKKEKKEEEKVEEIFIEKTKIIEFKEEGTVEVKSKEGEAPYFIHYVYAPQYFSDENPNACIVM